MAWSMGLMGASLAQPVGSFDLLTSSILTSATTTFTFNSLSAYASTYQHLQIRIVAKANAGSPSTDRFRMTINGSSDNLYRHILRANGSSVSSSNGGVSTGSIVLHDRLDGANFNATIIDLLDFYETKNKTIRCVNGCLNSNEPDVGLYSVLYNSTSPVNSITLGVGNQYINENSFAPGSRLSLYGLRAA